MINSAEQFVRLRLSEESHEYLRAASDHADIAVWLDIINRFPHMRVWVARNKTVPVDVLSTLASDPDPSIRMAVAMKNKLPDDLFTSLANDLDDGVRQRIS